MENRGALDIGSGTTKFLALRIDVCHKKILEVLFQERLALAFNEAYERAADQRIPKEFLASAEKQIETVLERMKEKKLHSLKAVATAVFRNAKNGREVISSLSAKWHVPIQIISQEEEAELGFWSVLAEKSWSPEQTSVVVWDIGGGSMQIYAWNRGRPHIFKGDLASVSFKNEVLKTLFFQQPDQVSSPNPLGRQKDAAVQIAKNHAVLQVPKHFKELPVTTQWVGIGGVLSLSVQKQVQADSSAFTQEKLAATLAARAGLSDAQIQSEYKVTDITNLALVLGYMKGLNIPSLHTVPGSLGQGLLYRDLFRRR